MSYLGNADTKLLFAENVRDDLIPNPPQTVFPLSQEVPGGYELNVVVLKRKHQFLSLLTAVTTVDLVNATTTIECADDLDSVILTRVQVGDFIRIQGAANSENNGIFEVSAVSYNDPNISITLVGTLTDESGSTLTLEISKDGPWEVLEPEIDYTIVGVGPNYNKQIQLTEALNEEDVCYVVHKASATYNFVPSPKSVGPDQLQENLRNFQIDRFEGDGVETIFELSHDPINGKAISVTLDGVISDGDDVMFSPPFTGDWFLDSDPPSGITRPDAAQGRFLTFTTPPGVGVKIRVLHLGFSTISRRASLSDGQVAGIPAGSIGNVELANNSITGAKIVTQTIAGDKIANNAIGSDQILLDNNESLNGLLVDAVTEQSILKIDATNKTILESLVSTILRVNAQNTIEILNTHIKPLLATIDLGSVGDKFQDLFLSNDANVDGDITVGGDINGINIATLDALASTLESRIDSLNHGRSTYDSLVPSGTIIMYGGSATPAGWLMCEGQSLVAATYPSLFSAIGYTHGGAGANFNVPDMRQRFPLGKAASGEGSVLGAAGGVSVTGSSASIGHTHGMTHTHNLSASGNLPAHTHSSSGLSATSPAHSHTMANHTHNMDHYHYVEPHFHEINSNNFVLKIPGAVDGALATGIAPPSYSDAASPSSPRFAFATGGTVYDMVLNSSTFDNSKSQTKRWFGTTLHASAKTNIPASPKNGSIELTFPGSSNVTTKQAQANGSVWGDAMKINTGLPSVANTSSTSATVTISGDTGAVNGTPTVSSTGSTTSISVTNTDEQSPPYKVLNFLIKV